MGKAEEVAKVLCFMLSDDASYVTGGKFIVRVRTWRMWSDKIS